MKAYRLTDRQTVVRSLTKAMGRPGRDAGGDISILSVDGQNNMGDAVLVRMSRAVDGEDVSFEFKENRLRLRLSSLDAGTALYSAKDVVLEATERTADRVVEISTERRIVRDVSVAPPVDIASSIALYGKTSGIAQACQAMRMFLMKEMNSYGCMVSDIEIAFFYNQDHPVFLAVESAGQPLYVIDALKKTVCTLEGFANPLSELEAGKLDAFFMKQTRESVRAEVLYPFPDQAGNIMGYMKLRSTMAGFGVPELASPWDNPGPLRLMMNYLRNRAEDLVFDMEMGLTPQWVKVSAKEVMLDISQDGRGCRITLHGALPEEVLRRGSKLTFSFDIEPGERHTFSCTVRNVAKKESYTAVGLRIGRGSSEESLMKLRNFAAGSVPQFAVT